MKLYSEDLAYFPDRVAVLVTEEKELLQQIIDFTEQLQADGRSKTLPRDVAKALRDMKSLFDCYNHGFQHEQELESFVDDFSDEDDGIMNAGMNYKLLFAKIKLSKIPLTKFPILLHCLGSAIPNSSDWGLGFCGAWFAFSYCSFHCQPGRKATLSMPCCQFAYFVNYHIMIKIYLLSNARS